MFMLQLVKPTIQIYTGQKLIYPRSEEHTSELQSQSNLVCRLLLEKTKHTDLAHVPEQSRMGLIHPVRPRAFHLLFTAAAGEAAHRQRPGAARGQAAPAAVPYHDGR